jgi:beta-carotene 15,15'-dioxygenase
VHGPVTANPSLIWIRRHPPTALAIAFAALAASLIGWNPSPTAALVIAVVAVVFGMPHGALDVALGPRLTHWALFFPAYGSAAAATVVLWFIAPAISLCAFLLFSWFHFGSGDTAGFGFSRGQRFNRGVVTGGLVLALPLAFHGSAVEPIFAAITFGKGAFLSADMLTILGTLVLTVVSPLGVLVAAWHARQRQWLAVAELVAIAALGVVASPLVSFSVYFALWHSPRHLLASNVTRNTLFPMFAATIATIVAAGAFWAIAEPTVETAVRVVFIGLAALTVPHLVVTSAIRSKRAPKSTV